MNLSYVTPSSPLTHMITGLLLPSCSFCIHRGLGLQSDSSITIEVPCHGGTRRLRPCVGREVPLTPHTLLTSSPSEYLTIFFLYFLGAAGSAALKNFRFYFHLGPLVLS